MKVKGFQFEANPIFWFGIVALIGVLAFGFYLGL